MITKWAASVWLGENQLIFRTMSRLLMTAPQMADSKVITLCDDEGTSVVTATAPGRKVQNKWPKFGIGRSHGINWPTIYSMLGTDRLLRTICSRYGSKSTENWEPERTGTASGSLKPFSIFVFYHIIVQQSCTKQPLDSLIALNCQPVWPSDKIVAGYILNSPRWNRCHRYMSVTYTTKCFGDYHHTEDISKKMASLKVAVSKVCQRFKRV